MSDGLVQRNLPCTICHGEMIDVGGGVTVRFESNGEAKDVFLSDGFAPVVQLFPANDYEFEAGGKKVKLTAMFEDALQLEYI